MDKYTVELLIIGAVFGWFLGRTIGRKFSPKYNWIWESVGAVAGLAIVWYGWEVWNLWQIIDIYAVGMLSIGAVSGWFLGRAIGRKLAPKYGWIWALVGAAMVPALIWYGSGIWYWWPVFVLACIGFGSGWFAGKAIGKNDLSEYGWVWKLVGSAIGAAIGWVAGAVFFIVPGIF